MMYSLIIYFCNFWTKNVWKSCVNVAVLDW